MTVEELSELYYITKEIERIQKDLAELEQERFQNKEEWLESEQKERKTHKTFETVLYDYFCVLQRKRMEAELLLEAIEDAETRLIIRLRVVNHMKWREIAEELDLERTTISKRFYKFFANSAIKEKKGF